MSRFRTEIVTEFSRLEEIAGDWKRLWEANPRAEVFQTFAWARASWHSYWSVHSELAVCQKKALAIPSGGSEGDSLISAAPQSGANQDSSCEGRLLCTPVVYEGGRICGVLPLVLEGGTLRFLGAPRADYNDVICEPDRGREVLTAAFRELADSAFSWHTCELEKVSEYAILATSLPRLGAKIHLPTGRSLGSLCPRVLLTSNDVLAGILKKKSLRRHENKLKRLGNVVFRHLESRQEIREHLPHFFRQHRARRALAGESSLFEDPRACCFYEQLVDALDPQRELRFAVVEIDGRPVAYHFGFEANGKFVWYKPAFDVELFDYSPGEVLLRKLFEYVGSRGLEEFDFTIGNEAFKSRFANSSTQNQTFYVWRKGWHGRRAALLLQAKERLKSYPRVLDAAKSAVARAQSSGCRLSTARRKHGLFHLSGRVALALYRAIVFRRDQVWVFSADSPAASHRIKVLQTETATVSDLARLCLDYPELLTPAELPDARIRIKRGDRLLVTRNGTGCVHLAWARLGQEVLAVSEMGPDCRIRLEKPALIITDQRTPDRGNGAVVSAGVFQSLTNLAEQEGCQTWICCRAEDVVPWRDAMERAGFRLRYRLRRIRILGCPMPSRIAAAGDLPNSSA